MSTVTVNGREYDLRDGQSLPDLLAQIGLGKRRVVVEHNGEPVAYDQVDKVKLSDGDRLEVVQLVGGG